MRHTGFQSSPLGCVCLFPLLPLRLAVDGELVGLPSGEILYLLKPETQLHDVFIGMWCQHLILILHAYITQVTQEDCSRSTDRKTEVCNVTGFS